MLQQIKIPEQTLEILNFSPKHETQNPAYQLLSGGALSRIFSG